MKVSSFQFTPKLLTVAPGTTVEWVNEGGRHSVVADDGSFKSEVLKQGDKFEHKFDKAGTFAYHCEFHGDKGGKDMAGKIVVERQVIVVHVDAFQLPAAQFSMLRVSSHEA